MSVLLLLPILFGGVIFVLLFWLVTDPRPSKEIMRSYGKREQQTLLVWQAITAILIIVTTIFYPLPSTSLDTFITTTGMIMYIVGLAIAIWAKLELGENWGMAGEDLDVRRQKRLTTGGPYRFSRNPMYVAVLLFATGFFIALRSYLIVLMLFLAIKFYKAIIKEEEMLEKQFGQQYRDYKAGVRRFL